MKILIIGSKCRFKDKSKNLLNCDVEGTIINKISDSIYLIKIDKVNQDIGNGIYTLCMLKNIPIKCSYKYLQPIITKEEVSKLKNKIFNNKRKIL